MIGGQSSFAGGIIAGSTGVSLSVVLGAQTGIAWDDPLLTAYYWRQGANVQPFALAQLFGPADIFVSGGWKEVSGGDVPAVYRLDVPNAAFLSGVDWVFICVSYNNGDGYWFERFPIVAPWNTRGSGLHSIDVVVVNAANALPVANQLVSLRTAGGGNIVGWSHTDEDGAIHFDVDDAQYTLTVHTSPGYEPPLPVLVTVDGGDEIVEIEIEPHAVTPPANPLLCAVEARVISTDGLPAVGVQFVFTVQIVGTTEVEESTFVNLEVKTATTDPDGIMRQELVRSDMYTTLLGAQTKKYRITCGVLGIDRLETLDTPTLDLGVLIVTT
jgi:hypothetical protein